MTDEKKPLELSFARKHDIIQAPMMNGRLGANYVMSRCDHGEVAYYNEVTRQTYPNVASLLADLKHGGRFHLACKCSKHRWFETIAPETIVALRAVAEGSTT